MELIGKRFYARRKGANERSFTETKANHGIRHTRMLGVGHMREQDFLTAAVQSIKGLAASFLFVLMYSKPCILF